MFHHHSNGVLHTFEDIRQLHHTHADHIESSYRGEARRIDKPNQIIIKTIDQTRTFIAPGKRLENRIILNGNETETQLNQLIAHYDAHQANCVVEINPANFYCQKPPGWEHRVLPMLLQHGFSLEDMRCVWVYDLTAKPTFDLNGASSIEVFGPNETAVCSDLIKAVEPRKADAIDQGRFNQGEDWLHFVGFNNDQPVSYGELFIGDGVGYLSWWFTHASYRRQGHHRAGIYRRIDEAAKRGCHRVFTVTDFQNASSLSLQNVGFRIAYNYLMLWREAQA